MTIEVPLSMGSISSGVIHERILNLIGMFSCNFWKIFSIETIETNYALCLGVIEQCKL